MEFPIGYSANETPVYLDKADCYKIKYGWYMVRIVIVVENRKHDFKFLTNDSLQIDLANELKQDGELYESYCAIFSSISNKDKNRFEQFIETL